MIFLPEEAIFSTNAAYFPTYFLKNASFRVVKRIFWLVQTIFSVFFQRLLPEKGFFLSSGNLFLNKSFIPGNGEGFLFLMETVTLLESFFLLAEIVTSMSGNQFLKTELILGGGN